VIVLLVALVLTPLITASNTDADRGFQLAAGETANVTEGLEVEAEAVNGTQSWANVTVRDTTSRLSSTQNITVGASANYSVAGENTTVTNNDINNNVVVRLTVDYSRTYGWSGASKTFATRLDVLLGLLGFLAILGVTSAVMRL